MKPKIPIFFLFASAIPPMQFLLVCGCIFQTFRAPTALNIGLLLFAVYLVPLAIYRTVSFFWPIRIGTFDLNDRRSWPWLFAIKLQIFYIAFPFLEQVLILFPELFSFWLRLWGSQVGKFVVWSQHTEILDRTHLRIGDYVIVGHRATLACHLVTAEGPSMTPTLLFAPVKVESRVLLGGFSILLPGSQVKAGTQLPMHEKVYPFAVFPKQKPLDSDSRISCETIHRC